MLFRFSIKDKFLRGSLRSHMISSGLHGERTIILKYDLNPSKPKQTKSVDQEDWVLSVLAEDKEFFVVSLSNGSATCYDQKCTYVSKQELPSEEFVKTAALVDVGEKSYLASGCQSGNIYWRQIKGGEIRAATSMCRLEGEAVEAMDANPISPELLIAGTSLGRGVLIDSSKVQNKNVQVKKGLKALKTDMRVVEHESAASLHAEAVTAVRWTSGARFASASFDHNVKISDCEAFRETWNMHFKDLVPTALEYHPKTGALLVGFDDGYIRLIDEKENAKKAARLYKSHSKWVSKISFLPSNPNVFASVGKSNTRWHTMDC